MGRDFVRHPLKTSCRDAHSTVRAETIEAECNCNFLLCFGCNRIKLISHVIRAGCGLFCLYIIVQSMLKAAPTNLSRPPNWYYSISTCIPLHPPYSPVLIFLISCPPTSELDPAQPVPAPAVSEGAERGCGQVLLVDAQPGEEALCQAKKESHQVCHRSKLLTGKIICGNIFVAAVT